MENDFTIQSSITLSDPSQCNAFRMLKRKGQFIYNAQDRSFTAKINNTILVRLLPSHLCKVRKKRCPNGKCLIIRFKSPPNGSIKELALNELTEADKHLVHSVLLDIVGVEQEIVLRKVELNKMPSAETHVTVRATRQTHNQLDLLTTPVKRPQPNSLPRPPNPDLLVKRVQPDSLAIPVKRLKQDPLVGQPRPDSLIIPVKRPNNDSLLGHPRPDSLIIPVKRPNNDSLLGHPRPDWLTMTIPVKRPQPDPLTTPVKRSFPKNLLKQPSPDFLLAAIENKENLSTSLERPDHEELLPEQFTRPDFWSDLRRDKRLRSGENGEWVKGQDERLTIDGLLCLCDGQWLNADIIDCYLDRICRFATRVQFIPTYAILSYGRMGTVPSEWYWKLAETDIVFAPAHLYNNHWAMAVLDFRERTLRLMDSMNHEYTNTEKTKFMDTIMNIIRDVAALQKVEIGDRSTWDVREQLSVPQQRNGTDCGIFALIFALYSLERRELNFSQCHIPFFRRRICHDIISVIIGDQKSS